MESLKLYKLLKVVMNNSNINLLLQEGIDFKQIGSMIEEASQKELIYISKNNIIISEKGMVTYKDLDKKFKKSIKAEWIQKEYQSQIKKLDIDFIYLPNTFDLYFF